MTSHSHLPFVFFAAAVVSCLFLVVVLTFFFFVVVVAVVFVVEVVVVVLRVLACAFVAKCSSSSSCALCLSTRSHVIIAFHIVHLVTLLTVFRMSFFVIHNPSFQLFALVLPHVCET